MNFSKDDIFDNQQINRSLISPQILEVILQPGESYVFEVIFTVPRLLRKEYESKSHCSITLKLTNPAKNFEEFGEQMLAILEIEPVDTSPLLVKSEYLSDEE
jgi:hypothetical protein